MMDLKNIKVISVNPPKVGNYDKKSWGFYTHPGWGKNCGCVDEHVEHTSQKTIKVNEQ